MPNQHSTLTSLFADIANAIRGKTGSGAQIIADEFPAAIAAIPSGGSDPVISPLSVTENGTYTAPAGVDGYSPVTVNVTTEEPIPASVSGYTEFDIGVTKLTGLTIPCYMDGEKDWGDGTVDSLTEHTYANYGEYTIVCKGDTLPTGSASGGGVFGSLTTNNNCAICLAVRVGNNVSVIGQYAFYACTACRYIHLPDTVTTLGSNATFRYCHTLRRIRLPASMNRFPGSAFTTCPMLVEVVNLDGIKEVSPSMFSACASLEKVKINPAVSTISASAFGNCTALNEIDFTGMTAIPTLPNVNALSGTNKTCRIIVPDSLYDGWIAATNWSEYASYIYKESEVQA